MLVDGLKFVLTRRELAALLTYASDDERRPHVCCVGFCPARGTATATSGHYLAELSSDKGATLAPEYQHGTYEAPDFVVPRAALDMALRTIGKDDMARVYVEPTKIVVSRDPGVVSATIPVDSAGKPTVTFPAYEQLFAQLKMDPDRETAIALSLNPKYLAMIATVGLATGEEMVTVHMPSSFLDPLLMTVEGWRVLVMPGRMPETAILQSQRNDALAKARREHIRLVPPPEKAE